MDVANGVEYSSHSELIFHTRHGASLVSHRSGSTILGRAWRLRCPRCGVGRLFAGPRKWFVMHERCEACGLKYERDRGYFLGSTYVNYGWTGSLLVVLYMGLHFGLGLSNTQLAFPLAAVFVGVPIVMWRHARSVWLAMDCLFDRTGFSQDK